MIRSAKIRKAAAGEDCTLRIPGVCNCDPEKTVLAHYPNGHGGMGLKADDLSAGFACHACHDLIDRRTRLEGFTEEDRERFMRLSMYLTIERLIERGIISL